jgi:hypothetical protein
MSKLNLLFFGFGSINPFVTTFGLQVFNGLSIGYFGLNIFDNQFSVS